MSPSFTSLNILIFSVICILQFLSSSFRVEGVEICCLFYPLVCLHAHSLILIYVSLPGLLWRCFPLEETLTCFCKQLGFVKNPGQLTLFLSQGPYQSGVPNPNPNLSGGLRLIVLRLGYYEYLPRGQFLLSSLLTFMPQPQIQI